MYVSKFLFLTNSVSLLSVYQILSESASISSKAVHHTILNEAFRSFDDISLLGHVTTCLDFALRHAYWPKHLLPVGALNCSLTLCQSNWTNRTKTLSPVSWQRWLVTSASVILVLIVENIRSSLNMGSQNSSKVLDYFERHYRRFISLRIYKIWGNASLCRDSSRAQARHGILRSSELQREFLSSQDSSQINLTT
jgi:hypothetical protein